MFSESTLFFVLKNKKYEMFLWNRKMKIIFYYQTYFLVFFIKEKKSVFENSYHELR